MFQLISKKTSAGSAKRDHVIRLAPHSCLLMVGPCDQGVCFRMKTLPSHSPASPAGNSNHVYAHM